MIYAQAHGGNPTKRYGFEPFANLVSMIRVPLVVLKVHRLHTRRKCLLRRVKIGEYSLGTTSLIRTFDSGNASWRKREREALRLLVQADAGLGCPPNQLAADSKESSPVPLVGIIAVQERFVRSNPPCERLEAITAGVDYGRVAERPGLGVLRAHGTEIDRPVSPASNMVHADGRSSAHLATLPGPLPNLGEGALFRQSEAQWISAAEQPPKLLPKRDLALGILRRARLECRPELPDKRGFFLAFFAAIGRPRGRERRPAVWALVGAFGPNDCGRAFGVEH